ncbi:adenylosuccinate synthase [Candidatus Roizmanbacteria bacterium]|nr:adenylosuccinate synthase [Candidatus Roizmanbacteria bacterium]
MNTVVLGTQWGDEGKGKIVDLLAEQADYVVRYHGGNNAGHTVVIGKNKYFFHLIPSGVFHPQTVGIIGNGVILDLEVLTEELAKLQEAGIAILKKLIISPRCHLILPYHKALDVAYENARGTNKLGTTGRGIGPAYADKVSYNGIRVYELLNWDLFIEKFRFQAKIKNKILKTFSVEPIDIEASLEKYSTLREQIIPMVQETYPLLQRVIGNNKNIVFEGAHGIMLDNDWSPYPFCTGSNTIIGSVNTGAGVSIKSLDTIIGVVKAYLSRVGGGPIPTEIHDTLADTIREQGYEYGTTTGRPRRIGWLDLEAVKFATEINSINQLAITKLDILSGLKELKLCTGYKLKGKKISYSECGYRELEQLEPIYELLPGWDEPISTITEFHQLPTNCQNYLGFIEEYLKVPIKIVSVSPERNATIRI